MQYKNSSKYYLKIGLYLAKNKTYGPSGCRNLSVYEKVSDNLKITVCQTQQDIKAVYIRFHCTWGDILQIGRWYQRSVGVQRT